MDERELGPLAKEISDTIRRHVSGDPTTLEMLTGLLDDAGFAALPEEERRLRIARVNMRTLEAHYDAILRLANEIEAINPTRDVGESPPKPH
jgi:hypothetical protein